MEISERGKPQSVGCVSSSVNRDQTTGPMDAGFKVGHSDTISKLMEPFIIICFGVNYPAGSILTFPLRGKGLLR